VAVFSETFHLKDAAEVSQSFAMRSRQSSLEMSPCLTH
jgi:hypothetical protein